MPTLPLFTPPPHPDGWHRVMAPGGAESWDFVIHSSDGRWLVVVGFYQGYRFYPPYLRRYALYRAMPTRFRPPLPAEYPCVSVAIAEMGRVTQVITNVYRPEEFEASTERLNVRIGANTAESLSDEVVHLRARVTSHRAAVAADLTLRGESVDGELRLNDAVSTPLVGSASREHVVSTDWPITLPRLVWRTLVPAWWSPKVVRPRA